jgi:uncharacterized membrane protein
MGETTGNEGLRNLCLSLYLIYAVSMLMQLVPVTILPGSFLIIAALIAAYARRERAKGTVFESHLQWLIRTFWIGGGIYMPVLTLAAFCFAWSRFDMGAVQNAIEGGAVNDTDALIRMVLEKNETLLFQVGLIITLPVAIWWIARCWRGWLFLKANEPMPDVMRWL